MVNGMKITWDSDNKPYSSDKSQDAQINAPAFLQTFIMTRREWPTPV